MGFGSFWQCFESVIMIESIVSIVANWGEISENTSLAAPGALANRLQHRTASKANEDNLDPRNRKSEITYL